MLVVPQASLRAEESVLVMEAHSGKVLVASNSSQKRPIASLTKIATGAVAVDWAVAAGVDLNKHIITVPQTVTRVGGPNPMALKPGDQLSLRDALYSALLGSDNLAALTIADHVGRQLLATRGKSGDPVEEFVDEMNRLAKGLGMRHTKFGNPHGLDRKGVKAYSTAADVARMSVHAMRQNPFNFIVRQPSRSVKVMGVEKTRSFTVRNTNKLIDEDEGILGVKTGTTRASGPCVAICSDREPIIKKQENGDKHAIPRRLIVVVLDHPDRFARAKALIKQGWKSHDAWVASGAPVTNEKRELIKVPKPYCESIEAQP